uniref:DEAD-box helicase 19A n=1 Tax=Oryctolagus cuniculus TaxID=9986 RepID=A0A5F9CFD1_RABIT
MATDSWALAVDEQEAAVKSISSLQIKEEKVKPETNGVVKTSTSAEKTDEDEKGNHSFSREYMPWASIDHPRSKRMHYP